jgi:regulator of protease activity HflC (stomatin/prohibitin superfamily)
MKVMDPYQGLLRDQKLSLRHHTAGTNHDALGHRSTGAGQDFEEREQMNASIVVQLDEATDPWGVQVTRYEIQNITVPRTILQTMELQVKAERDKRAAIARSIGEMESKINYSIGIMEEAINKSEGEMQRRINEAEGRAAEILAIAKANAASIDKIAGALKSARGTRCCDPTAGRKLHQRVQKAG